MNRVHTLLLVCVVNWICITCAERHVDSPAFKYSKQANEAAQKYFAEVHEGDSVPEHNFESNHHHVHSHSGQHGHSHHGHNGLDSNGRHLHHQQDKLSQDRASVRRKTEAPLDMMALWTYAIGAALLISVAPFLILIFIPISERTGHEDFLKTLLSFASGGLLGDAFLHLIPHAMNPHDHHSSSEEAHHEHSHRHSDHSHDNSIGVYVLMGILAFLIVEKFVRMVKGKHSHESHGHSHVTTLTTSGDSAAGEKTNHTKESDDSKKNSKKKATADSLKKKKNDHKEVKSTDIRVAAYLNLAADFAHNFTDGLAIGASFLAGNTAGIVSTVTILLHEVPHEIGDFAILVQSGMSKRKAMLMQLVTAVGCLSGTVLSLVAGGVGAANWVLPFTAGGFIYIATVSVIPELLENTRFWQSVKEIVALILGVSMMMLLTAFEESV